MSLPYREIRASKVFLICVIIVLICILQVYGLNVKKSTTTFWVEVQSGACTKPCGSESLFNNRRWCWTNIKEKKWRYCELSDKEKKVAKNILNIWKSSSTTAKKKTTTAKTSIPTTCTEKLKGLSIICEKFRPRLNLNVPDLEKYLDAPSCKTYFKLCTAQMNTEAEDVEETSEEKANSVSNDKEEAKEEEKEPSLLVVKKKLEAWKRYLERKEKEGKKPWSKDRWSKNYDQLIKARAAKKFKIAEGKKDPSILVVKKKIHAWKRYLERKEKEGKKPWSKERWSKNYDQLVEARAAKKFKSARAFLDNMVGKDNINIKVNNKDNTVTFVGTFLKHTKRTSADKGLNSFTLNDQFVSILNHQESHPQIKKKLDMKTYTQRAYETYEHPVIVDKRNWEYDVRKATAFSSDLTNKCQLDQGKTRFQCYFRTARDEYLRGITTQRFFQYFPMSKKKATWSSMMEKVKKVNNNDMTILYSTYHEGETFKQQSEKRRRMAKRLQNTRCAREKYGTCLKPKITGCYGKLFNNLCPYEKGTKCCLDISPSSIDKMAAVDDSSKRRRRRLLGIVLKTKKLASYFKKVFQPTVTRTKGVSNHFCHESMLQHVHFDKFTGQFSFSCNSNPALCNCIYYVGKYEHEQWYADKKGIQLKIFHLDGGVHYEVCDSNNFCNPSWMGSMNDHDVSGGGVRRRRLLQNGGGDS